MMTRKVWTQLGFITLAAAAAQAAADPTIETKPELQVESADGDFALEIGGRLQVDNDTYAEAFNFADSGDTANNSEFRRVRIFLEGVAYEFFESKVQIDFEEEDGTIDVEDAYLTYTRFADREPAGISPIIGNYKEPFGLEQLTSSKWISTIERSAATDFFTPGRSLGVGVYGQVGDIIAYQGGAFRGDINSRPDGGDSPDFAGRLAISPVHEDGMVLHLGGGYSRREFADNEIQFNANIRSGDDIEFGFDDDEDAIVETETFNIEAAGVFGPASLQGEYFDGDVKTEATVTALGGGDEFDASGYYAMATFTLTGESRGYKWPAAAFDKVKPEGPFGAWELVARYDHVEIDDGPADAEIENATFGVNWYVNSNVKISANYVYTRNDGASVAPIVGDENEGSGGALRFQFVF